MERRAADFPLRAEDCALRADDLASLLAEALPPPRADVVVPTTRALRALFRAPSDSSSAVARAFACFLFSFVAAAAFCASSRAAFCASICFFRFCARRCSCLISSPSMRLRSLSSSALSRSFCALSSSCSDLVRARSSSLARFARTFSSSSLGGAWEAEPSRTTLVRRRKWFRIRKADSAAASGS